jgi:hypothetical protein
VIDRPTALTLAWEYVGVAIVVDAALRAYRDGGLEASGTVPLFLGGVLLLAFGLRDHLFRDKQEMRAHGHSRSWLAMTAVAVAVVTYSLALTAASVA